MFREMEIDIHPLTELIASIPKEELTDESLPKNMLFYAWEVSQIA